MHDDSYFQQTIKNLFMWALVATLFIVSALIVFAPLVLAVRISPWWLLYTLLILRLSSLLRL